MQCSVGKTTSHLVALAPLETSRLPSEPHRVEPLCIAVVYAISACSCIARRGPETASVAELNPVDRFA